MKNAIRNKVTFYMALLIILLSVVVVLTFFLHSRAATVGTNAGKVSGNLVGTAIGSAKGITEGVAKGAEDGANAGLSAEDIEVDIKGAIELSGKLEVLTASVSLKDMLQLGDGTYSALYIFYGDAIFTTDLDQAEINFNQDNTSVCVKIPVPVMTVSLDETQSNKLKEDMKFSLRTNSEDGYESYINTRKKISENISQKVANYDSLLQAAKESAIKQVDQLVSTLCGSDCKIEVQFK